MGKKASMLVWGKKSDEPLKNMWLSSLMDMYNIVDAAVYTVLAFVAFVVKPIVVAQIKDLRKEPILHHKGSRKEQDLY